MKFTYNPATNRLWYNGKEIIQKGINGKGEKYFVLEPDNHWISWQNNSQTIFYKRPTNEKYIFYYRKDFLSKDQEKVTTCKFTNRELLKWSFCGMTMWEKTRSKRK